MAVLKMEIDSGLMARVEKAARLKNTSVESIVLLKLREFASQDLKRERALGELANFIERLNRCGRTRYTAEVYNVSSQSRK